MGMTAEERAWAVVADLEAYVYLSSALADTSDAINRITSVIEAAEREAEKRGAEREREACAQLILADRPDNVQRQRLEAYLRDDLARAIRSRGKELEKA